MITWMPNLLQPPCRIFRRASGTPQLGTTEPFVSKALKWRSRGGTVILSKSRQSTLAKDRLFHGYSLRTRISRLPGRPSGTAWDPALNYLHGDEALVGAALVKCGLVVNDTHAHGGVFAASGEYDELARMSHVDSGVGPGGSKNQIGLAGLDWRGYGCASGISGAMAAPAWSTCCSLLKSGRSWVHLVLGELLRIGLVAHCRQSPLDQARYNSQLPLLQATTQR